MKMQDKKKKNCVNCQQFKTLNDGLHRCMKWVPGRRTDKERKEGMKIENPDEYSCDDRIRVVDWEEAYELEKEWNEKAEEIKGYRRYAPKCEDCYWRHPISEEFEEAMEKTKADGVEMSEWVPLYCKVVGEEDFTWCSKHEKMVSIGAVCPDYKMATYV